MVYCPACGAQLPPSAAFCPRCGAPQPPVAPQGEAPRDFWRAIGICFRKYADFNGRAPRAEYWWWVLFQWLIGLTATMIDTPTYLAYFAALSNNWPSSGLPPPFPYSLGLSLTSLVNLALFLPTLSVSVRRLHDLDKSGWWLLLSFIPLIGWIILLVWACTRGTRGPNRFGPNPLPDA